VARQTAILGIDPGNNGAITLWQDWSCYPGNPLNTRPGGPWWLDYLFRLEYGEDEIVRFFRDYLPADYQYTAYLEKVHGWGEGRSFNFGKYYGFVRGCVLMRGIPIVDVLPQTWMAAMEVPKQRGEKARHRQDMRRLADEMLARRRIPGVKAANWSAAALLIGEYGIRQSGVYESELEGAQSAT
jgi:hypothetical protein